MEAESGAGGYLAEPQADNIATANPRKSDFNNVFKAHPLRCKNLSMWPQFGKPSDPEDRCEAYKTLARIMYALALVVTSTIQEFRRPEGPISPEIGQRQLLFDYPLSKGLRTKCQV